MCSLGFGVAAAFKNSGVGGGLMAPLTTDGITNEGVSEWGWTLNGCDRFCSPGLQQCRTLTGGCRPPRVRRGISIVGVISVYNMYYVNDIYVMCYVLCLHMFITNIKH